MNLKYEGFGLDTIKRLREVNMINRNKKIGGNVKNVDL